MSDQQNKVDSNEAREASKSRVTTLDSQLASLNAQPATEAVAEEAPEVSDANKETTDKPKVKLSPAQQRIMELATKRREAEKVADDVRRENDELRSRIKALETLAPSKQSERPGRLNFTDEDQYLEALTDWKIAQREKEQQQARLDIEAQEIETRYYKTVDEAKSRYPDFMDVVGGANIAIPDFFVAAVKESEIGGDLLYYLSKHVDEAKKIKAMRPIQAIKYLDRLERDLLGLDQEVEEKPVAEKTKPEVKRKAPEPISPVQGTKAFQSSGGSSFEEYKARRKAENRR